MFDTLVTVDGIADFIRQGWLSAFDYVSIPSDSEDQRQIDSLNKRGADGDFQVKEMNAVLNRRPTIGRLYESVRQYADGKKDIVYAVSIDHARNIAAYYSEHGIDAVAIDSKTPTKEAARGGVQAGPVAGAGERGRVQRGLRLSRRGVRADGTSHPLAGQIPAAGGARAAQVGIQGKLCAD